jgi:assimilatory nitrate reductase catalytic subunit
MHWTRQTACGATINSVTASLTDPVSGQPALKSAEVSLGRYDAKWYGFVASRTPLMAQVPYAAFARTATGWQAEMAGDLAPDDWAQQALAMTGLHCADVSVYEDLTSGMQRIALCRDGRIEALIYTSTRPVVLSRAAAIACIGAAIDPLSALAGRAAANQPDPGATVCACFNVGRNTLVHAISAGAGTIAQLAEATCAGTNCGSCKPELGALLAQARLPMAAE